MTPATPEDEDPVLLVGCVKSKREGRHVARDLYRSPLWRARRRYAEAAGRRWFILSALHGLVDPDRPLDYYDLALADRPASERREWAEAVVGNLEAVLGRLQGRRFEVHAGGHYIRAVAPALEARGAEISAPLAAIAGIGAQLAWYTKRTPSGSSAGATLRG